LLQKWQSERPYYQFQGGPLNSLSEAALILQDFAMRHCGAAKRTEKRTQKGWRGKLGGATETVERQVWAITQEEMQTLEKDEHGQLVPGRAQCAVLTLFGQPEAIVCVSLASGQCTVTVLEERTMAGTDRTGFFSTARESIAAQSEILGNCLNGFIQRGLFVKTADGLCYIKKP
jgi:hypothetical protein